MQFKILEAMACALPVVATMVGLGDIKASPDREIVVANTAADFATQVKRLLRDSALSEKIGRAAREFVTCHHSWATAANRLQSIYDSALARASVRLGETPLLRSKETPIRSQIGTGKTEITA
jgi:glycosyltransferase involved in cell wall biosynthesis